MKQSNLTAGKLHLKLPIIFSFTGLLITIVCAIAVGGSGVGLSLADTSQVFAASQGFQDEVQIELSSNGFTPAEVQRGAGTFAIAVENTAISGEYTLQLKAHDGTVIKEVQVQQGSAAWTVTLSAGEYTLTEITHPQWLCRITVQ
jgi:hypothetical protein